MVSGIARGVLAATVSVAMLAGPALGADPKVIKTQKVRDVNVSLLGESAQWKPGTNRFVLEFTSAQDKKPVDVGKVTLSTSMPMPGMAPMVAGATLAPQGPGRYEGTITFPDRGDRRVTVAWDGAGGKGSTTFSVPVR